MAGLRGERIGTAYVKILADGSGLSDSIRDELSEANSEEAFGQQGRRDSAAYQEGAEEDADRFGPSFVKKLVKGVQRQSAKYDDTMERLLSTNVLKDIENQFRTRFGDIGEQMVKNFREGLARSGGSEAFAEAFVGDLPRQVERAQIQFNREVLNRQLEMLTEAHKMNEKFDKDRLDGTKKMLDEAYRLNKEYDAKIVRLQQHGAMQERAIAMNRAHDIGLVRKAYQDLIASIKISEQGGFLSRSDSNFTRRIADLRKSIEGIGGDRTMSAELLRIEKRLGSLPARVVTFNRGLSRTADLLGSATGRGSRNNFLNFIGSMTRGFANLAFLVPKVAASIGGEFYSAFRRSGGGLSGLVSGVGALAPMALQLAAGLGAVALAAGVLFVVMSPLISLFSALLGIVAALVASIGFALVGAFSALGAIALPAVAALAIALGGILSMSDKMKKKFTDAFKPVKDTFVELGDVVAEVFTEGLTNQADRFNTILKSTEPLVRGIAEAIVDVGDSWLDMMEGPGFTRFVNAMTRFLPDAVRQLGDIVGQALGGIGGLLRGMIPFFRQVLDYLDDITQRFNDWANSAEGQNEIKNFFDDAAESLASVWGFLSDVWDLLTTVLSAGKDTGDSIFESMGRNIRRFTEYLQDNPDALNDWFKHAKKIATDIGELALNIGELIDKLDSPEGRAALHDMLSWMQDIAKITGPVADGLSSVAGAITAMNEAAADREANPLDAQSGWAAFFNNPPDFLAGWITEGISSFFEKGGPFHRFYEWLGEGLRELPGKVKGMFEGFGERVQEIWNTQVRKLLPGGGGGGGGVSAMLVKPFTGLNEKIGKAIGTISIMSLITLPNLPQIRDRFIGWGKSILGAIGDVDLLKNFVFPHLGDITSKFVGWAGSILDRMGKVDLLDLFVFPDLDDIAGYFSGLAGRILDAIGPIDIGSLIPDSVHVPIIGDVGKGVSAGPKSGRMIVGSNDAALQPFTANGVSGASATAGNGKTIQANGWTIVTPTEDPEAVATEVVNQLAAAGY